MKLAPSILSFDLAQGPEMLKGIDSLEPAVIHLDVMDGQFVPPITFGDAYVRALRAHSRTPFEAHLMTMTPERQFEPFAQAGCSRVIFHTEATMHAHRLIQMARKLGLEVGVAINPGTPVEHLFPVAGLIDVALVMTVNPGWGGQGFLHETLEKVRALRARHLSLLIEVDGGVDPATIKAARDAGAGLFVVGSYFAKAANLLDAKSKLEEAWG